MWLDAGSESLLEASNFIATIEKGRLKIACIEEVAYRMGFITEEDLKHLWKKPPVVWQEYLLTLA